MTVSSVETAPAPDGAQLLLSGERAAALGMGNRREAADPAQPVLLGRAEWLHADAMRSLADSARDFSRGPLGPLTPCPLQHGIDASAAIVLCRIAGLLPAVWLSDGPATPEVSAAAVLSAERRSTVTIAARARLPVDGLEADTQINVFRAEEDGSEHAALIVGAPGGRPPLVRLHSECLTGDVFGSLKCDCGPQLRTALKLIAAEGSGVLLYLRDEGRGIGLANKIRAYQLQDRGLDTVEANRRLGFADDARDYSLAAAMLRDLRIEDVRLLTNNPAKVKGLEAAGIRVIERVAHQMPVNPHNADYLAVKRARSGHLP
ncbi:MAG TPA: GTP cyclohydrolase II [Sphingomicrobium sp.]|nr:GTP cyclohydrolase II [Sphingomicrobium sp.]